MKIQLNKKCTEFVDYGRKPRLKHELLHLPYSSYTEYGDLYHNCSLWVVIHFCKNCGAELFGKWYVPKCDVEGTASHNRTFSLYTQLSNKQFDKFNDILHYYLLSKYSRKEFDEAYDIFSKINKTEHRAFSEFLTISNLPTCPCCHADLSHDPGYFFSKSHGNSSFYENEYSKYSDQMHKDRINLEKKRAKKIAASKIEEFELALPAAKTSIATNIKDNPEELKQYILNLIQIETNIIFLSKRLATLYEESEAVERNATGSTIHLMYTAKNRVKAAEDYLVNRQKHLAASKKSKITPPSIPMPTMPTKVTEPLYATPGFFNKKRILSENAQLKSQYEEACSQYEKQMEEYRKALVARENEIAQSLSSQEEKRAKKEQMVLSEIARAEEELTSAKNLLEEISATIQEIGTPEKAYQLIWSDELAQTEKLLKELIICKKQLYGSDVIFNKYHNLVALSTFYEYLLSGRCSSLEGPNGAYNIYENEIRLNRIIGQLDDVLVSLEQIKENQYMIYQAIQSVNSNLGDLNTSMNKMSNSLQNIDKSLSRIDAKTQTMTGYMQKIAQNSDVIAHNTAVTAHYSKITAELTNTLCYISALN